jgi:hypothetical protein
MRQYAIHAYVLAARILRRGQLAKPAPWPGLATGVHEDDVDAGVAGSLPQATVTLIMEAVRTFDGT